MIAEHRKPIVICDSLRSGFVTPSAENRVAREREESDTLRADEAMGGTSVGEEVEWGERTRRDKTGKEGMISAMRWCASARTAYSSSTLSSSRSPPGTMMHSSFAAPLSKIRIAVDLASGQSAGRVPDLPRMAAITRE